MIELLEDKIVKYSEEHDIPIYGSPDIEDIVSKLNEIIIVVNNLSEQSKGL